jgi:hypothetical protein
MGFEISAIHGLRQFAWTRTPGQDSAKQKSAEGRPRASNPDGAETPEEALAYIKQLSNAGRTDKLVGLLRRSAVFREAWQTLQQSSSTGQDANSGFASSIPTASPTPGQSVLPGPSPNVGPDGQLPGSGQDLVALQVTATVGPSPEIPAAQTHPVPVPKPSRLLASAIQVYQTQASYYAQEGTNLPRLSIMA